MPPEIERLGVKQYFDLKEGISGVDVINVLRIQRERQRTGLFPSLDEYAELYMLRPEHLKFAGDDEMCIRDRSL